MEINLKRMLILRLKKEDNFNVIYGYDDKNLMVPVYKEDNERREIKGKLIEFETYSILEMLCYHHYIVDKDNLFIEKLKNYITGRYNRSNIENMNF